MCIPIYYAVACIFTPYTVISIAKKQMYLTITSINVNGYLFIIIYTKESKPFTQWMLTISQSTGA